MDSWERFDETELSNKESFYSELNKEDITDEDHAHAQKVWEVFKIKNLGNCHDLYVQSDTLLLTDVFENFRKVCMKIYELDPPYFLSAPFLPERKKIDKCSKLINTLHDKKTMLSA